MSNFNAIVTSTALADFLASTQHGAGAALIGIEPIAGLVSTNLQAAIAELYSNPVFGADTSIFLPNSAAALVKALELISSLTTNTAGAEASNWLVKALLAGAQVTALDIRGDYTQFPAGVTAPSVRFALDAGFGYDSGQPALCLFINGRKHLLYSNALLMDPGASATGGLFLDQGQQGGIIFTGSGASVKLRAAGVDCFEATATGGIHWGQGTAGAIVTAARAVTFNGSGGIIHADATTPTTCIGISVAGAANGAPCRYVRSGTAAGVLSAATPGARFYLGTAGALTTTKNVTTGQSQIQVGIAVSATDLLVQISDRGLNP